MDCNIALQVFSAAIALAALAVSIFAIAAQKATAAAVAGNEERVQKWMHENTLVLQRRTSFFELWPHISTLAAIDPRSPVQVDVIKAVNALELTSVCWEANVVDRHMIRVAFLEGFLGMYEAINAISAKMPNGLTGPGTLSQSPIVVKVYEQLRAIKLESVAIPS